MAQLDPPSLNAKRRKHQDNSLSWHPGGGINLKWWNELLLAVRTAESLAVFKERLKAH